MKIFLCHSSVDKIIVSRLNDDLRTHGFDTWFDSDIELGSSILDSIQKSLGISKIILFFLSKSSVKSEWVKVEWQTKFSDQIKRRKIIVIPVLLEKCTIPLLLKDKKYIDFSRNIDYETNLSILLSYLNNKKVETNSKPKNITHIDSVYEYTFELLNELSVEFIALPVHKSLPIISTLATIPRSGKSIRLKNFKPQLSIRSIYDHILSVAHLADIILPHIKHNLQQYEFSELSRIIAFHELNEVILGDIPTYTNMNRNIRIITRNYAEERLRLILPEKRESIANDLIWMFLSDKQRQSLSTVIKNISDKNSNLYLIFKVFDKIDPIVATWRYLHAYRGKLGEKPDKFLKMMKDFFENPDIKDFIQHNKMDNILFRLVAELQRRENAFHYYMDSNYVSAIAEKVGLQTKVIKEMIEGVPLSDMFKKPYRYLSE